MLFLSLYQGYATEATNLLPGDTSLLGAALIKATGRGFADYARDKPKVVVRIVDTVVEQLVERVENGDVDLAIGPDREGGTIGVNRLAQVLRLVSGGDLREGIAEVVLRRGPLLGIGLLGKDSESGLVGVDRLT